MKRCWIHIGMPKTGSTSVQAYLAKHPIQQGWHYIALGRAPHMNREMHAMFGTKPHKWYWFAKRGDSPEQIAERGQRERKRLTKAVTNSQAENILISSEALTVIKESGIMALRDFLAPLCDEIRIIGYVRPPTSFMISFFQQRLKNGNDKFDITRTRPSYRSRFEKFDKVFGRENVHLYKFDPANFPGKCFVKEFCQRVGMPPPGEIKRVNESLSREACGILYAYRKFGAGYGVGRGVLKLNTAVVAPMFRMSGAKFQMSASLAGTGLDAEDIEWMRDRLGDPLDESLTDDGTGVSSEQDLLRIERKTCVDYASKFHEVHGLRIPDRVIPPGDPVDPRQAAEFLEYCRGLIRNQEEENDGGGSVTKSLIRGRSKAVFKWMRKMLAGGSRANGR